MKFTLSWLKTHLDTDASLDQITDTLTRIGLELESVEDRGAALAGFRIAHVIEAVRKALCRQKSLMLVGEMGTGKTIMGMAAIHAHAHKRQNRDRPQKIALKLFAIRVHAAEGAHDNGRKWREQLGFGQHKQVISLFVKAQGARTEPPSNEKIVCVASQVAECKMRIDVYREFQS